jgi:hypothetical protein
MTAPIITGFRTVTDDKRTLHYTVDPDLSVKLSRADLAGGDGATHVLITLDLDGEATDSVDVDESVTQPDVETLDRVMAAISAVREGLLS